MCRETTEKLHSADYFGEFRDHWWNKDFLELMAKRWALNEVSSVLDVGCGIGHWGLLLSPYLKSDKRIVGIDSTAEWIEKAHERYGKMGLGDRFEARKAEAESLPFTNDSFDMVTCQTLLMHVRDPKLVLSEMKRVLKPGGLLAVAEPNNLVSSLVKSSIGRSTSKICDLIRFQLTCEEGKKKAGDGNDSIGDLLPGYFSEIDMDDIQVYLSDKVVPFFPPYQDEEQKVLLRQMKSWAEQEIFIWEKKKAMEYFVAGGGKTEEFETCWAAVFSAQREMHDSVKKGGSHSANGVLMYLISSRKRV